MAVRFKTLKNMEPYALIRLIWSETDSFKLKCRGRCGILVDIPRRWGCSDVSAAVTSTEI